MNIGKRTDADAPASFDLRASRTYWRFAPSGAGKHDTSSLLNLNDTELNRIWDEAFKSRFLRYPEENAFLRQMSGEFAGKRVLSIGSGLGLHEIYYQIHGARVTCCDIIGSNLEVIRRVAAAKGVAGMNFIFSSGPDHDLMGPFDVVFLYGSLMTMPESLQRRLAARCLNSLAPGGSIVLMLYTWEFAHASCGWSSPEEFDAPTFARASDPSVGDEHCPWSDWHDDEKLDLIFGDAVYIARRQFWNQDWFVWYELRRAAERPALFFQPACMTTEAKICEVDLGEFQPVDAESHRAPAGLCVETFQNSFGYALASNVHDGATVLPANAILVEVSLDQGAISVGLLNAEQDAFAFAQAIWQRGRHQHVFAFDAIPSRWKVIISNFRQDRPGISRFVLHRVALLQQPVLEVPTGRGLAAPVRLRFPSCLEEQYPQQFGAAWAATNAVLETIPGSDFAPLAQHSPGLENYDWTNYIRLGAIRMVRVGAALRAAGLEKGRILDFGAYFGNFSLFARKLGFEVDAADQYGSYGDAFKKTLSLLRSADIGVIDLGRDAASDLGRIGENSYDAVLCLGVIEHVAHTPRPLLLALDRVLRPGGTLILETPNLSYLYTREKLAAGRPIAPPIQLQFDVEPPFEGHHREYTSAEVVWMLQQIGHEDIDVELFNYSIYGLSELRGEDAERFRRMERDPQLRELIMTRSKKGLL